MLRVKNVELVEARVEEAVQGREQREEHGEQTQIPERKAAAPAARGGRFVGGGLGWHREGPDAKERERRGEWKGEVVVKKALDPFF